MTMQEHKLPDGTRVFYIHRGECEYLYEEIFLRYCYERDGFRLPVDATGCVFDVGANIGLASYFFERRSPGILIHAFEPSPKTFEVLRANIERLKIRAQLHHCALAASGGTAKFTHYPKKSTMSTLFADPREEMRMAKTYMINEGIAPEDAEAVLELDSAFASEEVSCCVRTVSDVIDEAHVQRIELLKVDVEKAELEVLRGVRPEHWAMIQRIVVEVHDINSRLAQMESMLKQAGYRIEVEQDPKLKNTDLYYMFACRPGVT